MTVTAEQGRGRGAHGGGSQRGFWGQEEPISWPGWWARVYYLVTVQMFSVHTACKIRFIILTEGTC